MDITKCRTCLNLIFKHECTSINTKCYLKETVKQTILRLVPEMNETLQDDDVVCKKCINILETTLRFIETCLTVEALITYNKNISNSIIEVPEFDTKVKEENILDQIDFDHNYYEKKELLKCENLSSDVDDEYEDEKFDAEDSIFSEEIIIDTSVIDNDEECSYNTIDNTMSPIKIIVEEPSSPQGELQESIKLLIDSPEISSSIEKLDFMCPICLLQFHDEEEYKGHVETHVLLCEFCGKDFSDGKENEFKDHMEEHNKFIKICEFCGIIVQDTKSLRKHILSKHTSSLYLCDKCPKSFTDKYLVNAHIKGVHQKTRQKQCPACGKFFVNLDTCKNHYRLVHLKLKPYLCAICGKKFGRSDYLERHKAEHGLKVNIKKQTPKLRKGKRTPKHGVHLKDPGKPVKCNVCGKEVSTVHLLKGHLETHVKIRRYKCDFCDLTFSMLNNKKRHEKSHEKDSENKYRCNICWKRMRTKEELDHHVKCHDRPPQHGCDICGEKFHRKYLLDNHIAEKHISEEDVERALEEIVVKNLLEYANPNII